MQQDDCRRSEHIGFDEMGDAVTREDPGWAVSLLALAILIALFVLVVSGTLAV